MLPAVTRPCRPEDLHARVRVGDPELLADLFRCFRGDLLAFLRRRCGNPSDAEDAAQDAFVNATVYLGEFRGEATLRSWLYRLASSACTRMRRGRKGDKKTHVPFEEALAPLAGLDDVESRLDARLGPLEAALAALQPLDRAVLLLRDGEGLSAREVATELGLTESAVKSRLHRARSAVRQAIEV